MPNTPYQRIVCLNASDCEIVQYLMSDKDLGLQNFSAAVSIILREWANQRGLPVRTALDNEPPLESSGFIHPPFP